MKSNNKDLSRLSRRILLRYFLSLFAFIGTFIVLYLFALFLYRQFPFQMDNPIYTLAIIVRENLVFFIGMPLFIGWVIITYRFLRLPLSYLDDVINASEKLITLSDEQIILPETLKSVQDDLNHIRETSINNERSARENEQRKNDLIMYLAHDLKTPIASIIGYLTLIEDENLSPETQKKYVSTVLNKAERLDELINEFFEITRFNLAHIELSYGTIDLSRMLDQLAFEFKPMLDQKELNCVLELPSSLSIQCDANQLERVFDNLFRNAISYSYPGTQMQVSVRSDAQHVIIDFLNHGQTIPNEKLERIFDQFFRLDSSRSTQSGGAGLGLAIAKSIVNQHHGTLEAKSADETICFTITLPLKQS